MQDSVRIDLLLKGMKMLKKYQQFFLCAIATLGITACTNNGNLFTMNIGDLRTEAEVVNKFVETICANPLVQTHLTPQARSQLALLEDKVQNVLIAMESEEKDTISVDLGKNWDKYLMTDLTQVLDVLQPLGPELTPGLNHYIQLGYAVIEILETLGNTNLNTPAHTPTMVAIAPYDRDRVNLEVWAGPQD